MLDVELGTLDEIHLLIKKGEKLDRLENREFRVKELLWPLVKDSDRFKGKYFESIHPAEMSDALRRVMESQKRNLIEYQELCDVLWKKVENDKKEYMADHARKELRKRNVNPTHVFGSPGPFSGMEPTEDDCKGL